MCTVPHDERRPVGVASVPYSVPLDDNIRHVAEAVYIGGHAEHVPSLNAHEADSAVKGHRLGCDSAECKKSEYGKEAAAHHCDPGCQPAGRVGEEQCDATQGDAEKADYPGPNSRVLNDQNLGCWAANSHVEVNERGCGG